MRTLGFILIGIGLALFIFIIFNFLRSQNKIVSPIPEQEGVKVIFVTPTE